MSVAQLGELRRNACKLFRRTRVIFLSSAGHPRPTQSPAPGAWRRWSEIADLFDGPDDTAWPTDRDRIGPG